MNPYLKYPVLILLTFIIQHILSTEQRESSSSILQLNDDNFNMTVETYSRVMVAFYVNWCDNWKVLNPLWTNAAKSLSESLPSVKFASINVANNNDTAVQFSIDRSPTIKLFLYGKGYDYMGEHDDEKIVKWLTEKFSPMESIDSIEQLQELKAKHDTLIIGLFNNTSAPSYKSYIDFAEKDVNNIYMYSTNALVRKFYDIEEDTVVLLTKHDDERYDWPILESFEFQLQNFIEINKNPIILPFEKSSAAKIFGSKIKKFVFIFTDVTNPTQSNAVLNEYKKSGELMKGRIIFVNVGSNETKFCDFFGVTRNMIPMSVISDLSSSDGRMKVYNYHGPSKMESITNFINEFFSGKLKQALRSEPLLPSDLSAPVKVVKGDSFDTLVIDNDKDVFLEFYSPQCSHCKRLEPIWEDLASELEHNKHLIIAKMDATNNQINYPGIEIKGFPTIYMFPGRKDVNGLKIPIKFDGDKDFDGFFKFITKSAVHRVSVHEENEDDEL